MENNLSILWTLTLGLHFFVTICGEETPPNGPITVKLHHAADAANVGVGEIEGNLTRKDEDDGVTLRGSIDHSIIGRFIEKIDLSWKPTCNLRRDSSRGLVEDTLHSVCVYRMVFHCDMFNEPLLGTDLTKDSCEDTNLSFALNGKFTEYYLPQDKLCKKTEERQYVFLKIIGCNHTVWSRGTYMMKITISDPGCTDNGSCNWNAITGGNTSDGRSYIKRTPMLFGSRHSCSLIITEMLRERASFPEMKLITLKSINMTTYKVVKADLRHSEGSWTFTYSKIGEITDAFTLSVEGRTGLRDVRLSGCAVQHGHFSQYECTGKEACAWLYNDHKLIFKADGTLGPTKYFGSTTGQLNTSIFSPILPESGQGCKLSITTKGHASRFTVIAHSGNRSFPLSAKDVSLRSHTSSRNKLQLCHCHLLAVSDTAGCMETNWTNYVFPILQSEGGWFLEIRFSLADNRSYFFIKSIEFENCTDMAEEGVSYWKCDFEISDLESGRCDFLKLSSGLPLSNNSTCGFRVENAENSNFGSDHTPTLGYGHFLGFANTLCTTMFFREGSFITEILQPDGTIMKDPEDCQVTLSVRAIVSSSSSYVKWRMQICRGNNSEASGIRRCEVLNSTEFKEKSKEWKTYKLQISPQNTSFFIKFSTLGLFSDDQIAFDDIIFNPSCFHYIKMNAGTLPSYIREADNGGMDPWIPSSIVTVAVVMLLVIVTSLCCRKNCACKTKHVFRPFLKKCTQSELSTPVTEESLLPGIPEGMFDTVRNLLSENNPNYAWYSGQSLKNCVRIISPTRLRVQGLLGTGMFGEVYKGLLLRQSSNSKDTTVAIKKLSSCSAEESRTDFILEALTLSKFTHRNIMRCLGITMDRSVMLMVLEFLEGGDLKSFLADSKRSQPQPEVTELLDLALDVANAGQYLGYHNFVHRDLAARNILLTKRGPGQIAKIGDFGMARDMKDFSCYIKSGQCLLPLRWMPPESFTDGVFSTKTDVWSFGILLWEIFTFGEFPYSDMTNQELQIALRSGYRLDYPASCHLSICSLMKCCWETNPNDRPEFADISQKITDIKDIINAEMQDKTYSYPYDELEEHHIYLLSGERTQGQ